MTDFITDLIFSTRPIPRKTTYETIAKLYRFAQRKTPWVVACEGPFQLMALPTIFVAVVRSQLWRRLSADYRLTVYPHEDWDPFWQQLWDEIIAEKIETLKLKVAQHRYDSMFDKLKARLKSELHRRLKYEAINPRDNLSQRLDQLTACAKSVSLFSIANDLRDALELSPNTFSPIMRQVVGGRPQSEFSGSSEERDLMHALMTLTVARRNNMASLQTAVSRSLGMISAGYVVDFAQLMIPPWEPAFAGMRQVLSEFLNDACGFQKFELWQELMENIFAAYLLEHIAFTCQRPLCVKTDDRFFPHCEDGPSMYFDDGMQIYAWHGVAVEQRIIEEPESIKLLEIEKEANTEIRRVLIERYGAGRYLMDTGAEVRHQDEYGTLYEKPIPGAEPLVMVRVKNSTAEPDGTFKDYFLRVPPQMETAKQAVAWTFGMDEDEYAPAIES